MKNLFTLVGCIALFAGVSFSSAHAQDPDSKSSDSGKFAVGLGVGTTGATLEAQYRLSDTLAVRGNFNYLSFSYEDDEDDIDFDGDFDATTFGAFVDYAPFQNGFVLSGGAFLGDKQLDFRSRPDGLVQIGDFIFTPDEVGTLVGGGELNTIAPYAGLGYDAFIAGSKNWSFNARAGVMYVGSADVDLFSVDGTLSENDRLREQLELEIAEIEDDVDDFRFYPVLTIGISRRF